MLVQQSRRLLRVPGGGQAERVSLMLNVPGQLPEVGTLHWCAVVDRDDAIAETDEGNNLTCVKRNPFLISSP